MAAPERLSFPPELRARIDPYLPKDSSTAQATNETFSGLSRPFVTLTYAVSLDSQIAAAPGVQTVLSGSASKAMTHYLRTRHDAIAIGAGTAIADDPTLNSRIQEAFGQVDAQPRPIVLDRRARWRVNKDSKVMRAASKNQGKAPWIVVSQHSLGSVSPSSREELEAGGGSYIPCDTADLPNALAALSNRGIASIMIEGGGVVINDILSRYLHLVDSIIITIAPVYLGQGGVSVCPHRLGSTPESTKFVDVTWTALGADTVMCARPAKASS